MNVIVSILYRKHVLQKNAMVELRREEGFILYILKCQKYPRAQIQVE